MNKYGIAVHYEEGFTVEVTATNVDEARKVAEDYVNEYCGVRESFNDTQDTGNTYLKTYHRDCWIVGEN